MRLSGCPAEAQDELFGGHVTQRADHVAGMGEVLRVAQLGQSEVGDPDRAAAVQEQVGRLDVAVQGPLLMGVLQGVGNLDAEPGHVAPVREPAGADRGDTVARRRPAPARASRK